jgi:hypothetical protein
VPAREAASGGARGETHGVPVLGVADELGGSGVLAAQGPAELADDAAVALEEVHALADERCATAVAAAMAIGRESADAAAQERALELLDVGDRRGHVACGFRRVPPTSSPPGHFPSGGPGSAQKRSFAPRRRWVEIQVRYPGDAPYPEEDQHVSPV